VATVPTSRVLPAALKANGLRNLPSIIHGEVAIDTVEEIIDYINMQYPSDSSKVDDSLLSESVDKLTRNFFSKFCFYIKSVSKDSSALLSELKRLDELLKRTTTR
jgi:tRNA G37 N-methylase Trm5